MNIELGKWYLPFKDDSWRLRPRWVLAVNDKGVLYGNGGSKHFECSVKTFRRWIKAFKVQLQ